MKDTSPSLEDEHIPLSQQLKYWGIASAVFLLALWYLGDVLLPFVIGSAIAYFLDPVADRLEKLGASRIVATAIITVAGALAALLSVLLVVPTLISQATQLVNIAPQLASDLQAFLISNFPSLFDEASSAHQILLEVGQNVKSRGGQILNSALASAASILGIGMMLVIVPVVTVYMLLDWDRMISRVDDLLPREHAPVIRRLASEIDSTLAAFIRGMGTVCLILGGYYAIALMAVGLQFGLVVGAVAGFLTFIPYVGSIFGGALAIGLALFQFWGEWHWIAAVVVIFGLGQLIEGNYLTPKLVGSSVGLHPVWLMVALSVFGSLFGFIGMLIAVPITAAIGVFARFGTEQYLGSRLYRGPAQDAQDAQEAS